MFLYYHRYKQLFITKISIAYFLSEIIWFIMAALLLDVIVLVVIAFILMSTIKRNYLSKKC